MNKIEKTQSILTDYLTAAEQLRFDGSSFIDGNHLYLCGDACRLAYEDVPADLACFDCSDMEIGDVVTDPELIELSKQIKWVVEDLEESVPAKMVISADGSLWMQGPDGSGLAYEDDFCGWLLFPVQMTGVDDFKRLYPLVIDVICAEDISAEELKEKSDQLYTLVKDAEIRNAMAVE
jgi:hypothetical protein